MNLNVQEWKRFKLEKLFDIQKGKRLTTADQEPGTNNYVGAIDSNNGVANHIGQAPIHKANTISLSYNGSVGEAFYQKDPYWATDDVNALYPYYENFNKFIGLFFVTVLRKEKYKFSYGRKWTLENMNNTFIKLPVQHKLDKTIFIDDTHKYSEEGYVPDWSVMEDYIKSLHYKHLTTQNKIGQASRLNIAEWKEFKVGKILLCSTTSLSIKDNLEKGNIPFISRTSINNGCDTYVDIENNKLSKGNCITIGAEGIYAFYQPDDFATGNKIYTLEQTCMNKYIALFLCTILNQEYYKYSYGRARIKSRLEEEVIKLPIQYKADKTPFIDETYQYSEDGYVPDWGLMELYIKSLPYGDKL